MRLHWTSSNRNILTLLGVPSMSVLIGISSSVYGQVSEQMPAPVPAPVGNLIAGEAEIIPTQRAKAPLSAQMPRKAYRSSQIDWTTLPSTYTHDDKGQRVDQYNSGEEPTVVLRNDIYRSGYRHTRSTIQAGFTSDNYHSVEQWGDNVQPYGEWRYPNRPFSVPYSQWGPQMPQIMGGGWGWMGGGGMGGAYPGPYSGMIPGPGNVLGPTQDDYYPQAPIMSAPGLYGPQGNGPNWNNNSGQGWGNVWGQPRANQGQYAPGRGPSGPPFSPPMNLPNNMPPAGNPLGLGLQ